MNINGKNGLACLLYIEPSQWPKRKSRRKAAQSTTGAKSVTFTAKAASQLKFSRCHTPMSWRIWNIPFISTFRPLPGNNWNILKLWCAPGYFTSLQDLVPDLTNFYNQWPHWLQMPWPRCVTVRQRLPFHFDAPIKLFWHVGRYKSIEPWLKRKDWPLRVL